MSRTAAIERKTLSVTEAAQMLGIGKTYAYAMAHTGELPGVRKIGTRYIVSKAALEDYIDGSTEPKDAA